MIVGAGEAGAWAINVCKTNTSYGHVILAVDDDPNKLGQTIHGVPVRGTLEEIPDLCTRYNIHTIIVAIPTLKGNRLNHVIDLCRLHPLRRADAQRPPSWWVQAPPQQGAFRELNTADFLSREEVTLDTEKNFRLPHRQDRSGDGRRRQHRQRALPSGHALQACKTAYLRYFMRTAPMNC